MKNKKVDICTTDDFTGKNKSARIFRKKVFFTDWGVLLFYIETPEFIQYL